MKDKILDVLELVKIFGIIILCLGITLAFIYGFVWVLTQPVLWIIQTLK